MLNNVNLHGRLTRDPELKTANSGKSVVNLRIAVQRPKRNGEDAGADYIDVVAFGTTAENVERYLSKGRSILVNGRLHHNEWTDNDGNKRQKLEVIANEIEFLSGGKPADASADEPEEVAAGSDDFEF